MKIHIDEGLFWFNVTNNCFERNVPGIFFSPFQSKVRAYPPLLDVIGSLEYIFNQCSENGEKDANHSVFNKLISAYIPFWEEVVPDRNDKYYNGNYFSLPFHSFEINHTEDLPIIQNSLINHLIALILNSFSQLNIYTNCLDSYDEATLTFLDKLMFSSKRLNYTFFINKSTSIIEQHYKSEIEYSNSILSEVGQSADHPSLKYIALAPQGLPSHVLQMLGIFSDLPPSIFKIRIGEEETLFLDKRTLQHTLTGISFSEQAKLHREIFDNWKPCKWGYIKRAYHALRSDDLTSLKKNYLGYSMGVMYIGFEFLINHYKRISLREDSPLIKKECFLNMARLFPRINTKNGFEKSIKYFKLALRLSDKPYEKLKINHELANLYANKKTPDSLKKSRKIYSLCFDMLKDIPDEETRIKYNIGLLNGLALVEYHENRNNEALMLEKQAQNLITSYKELYPDLRNWAEPLIITNTAKLLMRRFNNYDDSIILVDVLASSAEEKVSFHAKRILARQYYEINNFEKVVDILLPIFDADAYMEINDQEEIFDILILSISLYKTNRIIKLNYYIDRLENKRHVISSPEFDLFLKQLRKHVKSSYIHELSDSSH